MFTIWCKEIYFGELNFWKCGSKFTLSLCFVNCFFRFPFNNLAFLYLQVPCKVFSLLLSMEDWLEVYFNSVPFRQVIFLVEINCGMFQRFITGLKDLSPSHFLLQQRECQQICLVWEQEGEQGKLCMKGSRLSRGRHQGLKFQSAAY